MTEQPRVLGGRYEVGDLIGRGGMAEVHVGHDLRLGRTVAIKILRTDLARDTSFLARFRREAQAAAGLNHPAIVAVYDSGEQEIRESGGAPVQVPYIVMEHVDGRTLRDVLNDERVLDPDEAARVTASVLAALEFSHDRGIVHRDIKPANVMMTRGGAVKVMDFGIARALADTAATMTQTQAVLGTARYLSPEQAQGLDVDARSDLYSAGCLFYELLTGRTPFVGDPVSLVYQHIGEAPKQPSSLQPDLPEAMDAVALHALEKSPDARYQSAAEFRADLNAARAARPVSAPAQRTYDRMVTGRGADTEAIPRAQRTAAAAGAAAAARATSLPGGRGAAPGDRPRRRSADDDEDTDEIPVREERHGGGWLMLSLLALLALAGVGWIVFQVLSPGTEDEPEMVTVPYLLNETQEVAESRLLGLGLVPEIESVSSEQEAGTVISQDPGANTRVRQDSTVVLEVSTGPGAVTIPDVRGYSEEAARTRLTERNITVAEEVEEVHDPDVDAERVVRTEPEEGQEVTTDEEVTLVLASGRVEVPELTGLDAAEAIDELEDHRLAWELVPQETGEVEPSTVLAQSEEAGAVVDYETVIELTVARQPARTHTITGPPVTVTEPPVTVTPPPTSPREEPDPPADPDPTTAGPTPTAPSETNPVEPPDARGRRGPPDVLPTP